MRATLSGVWFGHQSKQSHYLPSCPRDDDPTISGQQANNRVIVHNDLNAVKGGLLKVPGEPASRVDERIRCDGNLRRPLVDHHLREVEVANEEPAEQEKAEDGDLRVELMEPPNGEHLLARPQVLPGAGTRRAVQRRLRWYFAVISSLSGWPGFSSIRLLP